MAFFHDDHENKVKAKHMGKILLEPEKEQVFYVA